MVKLLYDGQCPMCSREARWLKRQDGKDGLQLVDITGPDFDPGEFGLSRDEVMRVIHAVLPDGRVLRRMDAIRAAYAAVGRGWLLAPTTWPGLRWLTDLAYTLFARNRMTVSRMLGRPACDDRCR